LVLFTDDLLERVSAGVPVESVALADGEALHFVPAGEGEVFGLSATAITLVDAE
jgi:hypothetical protein